MASYLAYVTYPPLYIAGPLLTYNGFASQLLRPRPIGAMQVFSHHHMFTASMCRAKTNKPKSEPTTAGRPQRSSKLT